MIQAIFAILYFYQAFTMEKIITFLLLLSLSQLSLAQNTQPKIDIFSHSKTKLITWKEIIESRWKNIDKDNNNMLDKSEIQHLSSVFFLLSFKYFKDLDNNHDGFVSHEELTIYSQEQETQQKQKINLQWNQVDTNSDYKISIEDANENNDIKDNFNKIDTNQDNDITPDEFINFYNKTVSSKLGL